MLGMPREPVKPRLRKGETFAQFLLAGRDWAQIKTWPVSAQFKAIKKLAPQ